jgi:hypothetical protein
LKDTGGRAPARRVLAVLIGFVIGIDAVAV